MDLNRVSHISLFYQLKSMHLYLVRTAQHPAGQILRKQTFIMRKKPPQYSKVNTCLTLNNFTNSVGHVYERAGSHKLIFFFFHTFLPMQCNTPITVTIKKLMFTE